MEDKLTLGHAGFSAYNPDPIKDAIEKAKWSDSNGVLHVLSVLGNTLFLDGEPVRGLKSFNLAHEVNKSGLSYLTVTLAVDIANHEQVQSAVDTVNNLVSNMEGKVQQ